MPRHAAIDIDLGAIASNVAAVASLAPDSQVCAVVKADGYGHGAVPSARAALAGGATWLAVALVEEGQVLRSAGIEAPILLLSEPPGDAMVDAHRCGLTPTLYTAEGVRAAACAAEGPWSVHLKVDTGMHRVGAPVEHAVEIARMVDDEPRLQLGGTFTHLAVADEPTRPETQRQLDRFDEVLAALHAADIDPGLVHSANSAGAIAHERARRDLVRVGIAIYGIDPSPELSGRVELRPAMTVRAEVTMVKHLPAGAGISYGHRYVTERDSTVAVVPLGYADGVPRRLGLTGGEVLIGGARRPIRGVVTMDQLIVDITEGPEVQPGDPVVMIGEQGDEHITAQEWAERVDTIAYEIVCSFGARLPRRHLGVDAGTAL